MKFNPPPGLETADPASGHRASPQAGHKILV
jgi:hypothetical protein